MDLRICQALGAGGKVCSALHKLLFFCETFREFKGCMTRRPCRLRIAPRRTTGTAKSVLEKGGRTNSRTPREEMWEVYLVIVGVIGTTDDYLSPFLKS